LLVALRAFTGKHLKGIKLQTLYWRVFEPFLQLPGIDRLRMHFARILATCGL
jgi:hypothetical protein